MGSGASSKENEVIVIQTPSANGNSKENSHGNKNFSSSNLSLSRTEILERRCKFLSDENTQLKTNLVNLENERSELIDDINHLEEEIRELSSEASLNAAKENFQNLIEGKDIIIKNLEIQLKANELRLNEMKGEYVAKIHKYQAKLDELKGKHASKSSKKQRISRKTRSTKQSTH